MLVHHADAARDRIGTSCRNSTGSPFDVDLDPRRAAYSPKMTFIERALARAVLAEQAVHLAVLQVEVDLVVGERRPGTAW